MDVELPALPPAAVADDGGDGGMSPLAATAAAAAEAAAPAAPPAQAVRYVPFVLSCQIMSLHVMPYPDLCLELSVLFYARFYFVYIPRIDQQTAHASVLHPMIA